MAELESLNLRIGYNDYKHLEFEPDGAGGTTFASEGYEGRFELVHSEWEGLAREREYPEWTLAPESPISCGISRSTAANHAARPAR